jgi:hypothetical protein
MLAPHQAHYMAADARHAELQANAARVRFAANGLRPQHVKSQLIVHRRLAAALGSIALLLAAATTVGAAVIR